MKYNNIVSGRFLDRPNRFIAHVDIEGKEVICHVKNTGRCKELLIPGETTVFLEDHGDDTKRKTRYSLISVIKKTNHGNIIINMDSQAPNKVVEEYLNSGDFIKNITYIKRETKYGDSRFDFYFEYKNEEDKIVKAFMEVKGVTLENDGIVKFPDAPTERGTKHIKELIKAIDDGYESYIMFVVQMERFNEFKANEETDKKFSDALEEAKEKGVNVIIKPCYVTRDTLKIIK